MLVAKELAFPVIVAAFTVPLGDAPAARLEAVTEYDEPIEVTPL